MDDKSIETLSMNDLPDPYNLIAAEIGIKNTLAVARIIGGSNMYFPKLDTILRPLRDNEIRQKFNGYNFKELAMEYGLTDKWIREICSDAIKRNKTSL